MQLRSVSGMNIPQGHRPVPITIGWSLTLTPFDQQPSSISTLRTAVPRYLSHALTTARRDYRAVSTALRPTRAINKDARIRAPTTGIFIFCCVAFAVLYWTSGLLLLLPLFGPRELLAAD